MRYYLRLNNNIKNDFDLNIKKCDFNNDDKCIYNNNIVMTLFEDIDFYYNPHYDIIDIYDIIE